MFSYWWKKLNFREVNSVEAATEQANHSSVSLQSRCHTTQPPLGARIEVTVSRDS